MSLPYVRLKLIQGGAPLACGPAAVAGGARVEGPRSDASRDHGSRSGYVERLFAEHRSGLQQYLTRVLASSEDAEEVVQETCIRLLKAPRLEPLEGNAARRFVFKIALNLARDRFRQRKARSHEEHVSLDLAELAGDGESPDEIVDWNAGLHVVRQVLFDLPPRHRRVFLLHVTESMSYRAIAKHLDISTKTVERDLAMVLELCQGRLRTLGSSR